MTATAEPEENVEKPSRIGLVIGLVMALAGGVAGFYSTYSGLVSGLIGGSGHAPTAEAQATEGADAETPRADVGFVPLEPITISLGPRAESRYLRFSAQLEVAPAHASEVEYLIPRIMDVLNIYLRALDPLELEEPAALLRLRAQMLRRVQIVTGPGYVSDLLVMEFVLN